MASEGGKMEGCAVCIKYTLGIINLLLFIGGVVIMGIGIWSLVSNDSFEDLLHFQMYKTASILVAATGAFIALVTFLGCCGAFKESKVLLYLYFLFVLILFILLLVGGILAYVYRDKIPDLVADDLEKTMTKYSSDKDVQRAWDETQMELECCGLQGPTDWTTKAGLTALPKSCCKDGSDGCINNPVSANTYQDGCIRKVEDSLKNASHVVAGVAITVAVILLLALVMACMVIRAI